MSKEMNEFQSISDLVTELNTLICLLHGAGEQSGMIEDLKQSNEAFSARVEQIQALMEMLADKQGTFFATQSQAFNEQLDRLRELADILDTAVNRFDGTIFAEAALSHLKPALLMPVCEAIDRQALGMSTTIAETTVPAVLALLTEKIEEIVVLRREDIVSQVANEVRGEMMELLAVDSLRELQENYRVLREKNRRLLLLSCAGGVGCLLFALLAWL